MILTRRQLLKFLGVTSLGSLITSYPLNLHGEIPQTPMERMPLEDFVKTEKWLAALRTGVKEMKKRKPSDPLSWFYQAAIHGVSDAALQEQIKIDPDVRKVLEKDVWNQCPHNGQNSANFLPWHRAYTYHVEKIVRHHSGMSDFSLPYWNYLDRAQRKFPKEFGVEHLDGNLNNSAPENINPLFLSQRDFYFTSYEHPFSQGLPLLALSDEAVSIDLPMNSPVFFGSVETEGIAGGIADLDPTTRGLIEKYPHDQIHRAVGGIVLQPQGGESVGAMANPPTAAFDPIFPIHHCTVDLIWVRWSLQEGRSWGDLPSQDWFNATPWTFVETDGKLVKQSRRSYFDHRALGIRYKGEDLTRNPLALPSTSTGTELLAKEMLSIQKFQTNVDEFSIFNTDRSMIAVMGENHNSKLKASAATIRENPRSQKRILLRFRDVQLGLIERTGFDLYLTSDPDKKLNRSDPSFIGSVVLFGHSSSGAGHGGHHGGNSNNENPQTFDVTRALAASSSPENAKLVIVPFSLLSSTTNEGVLPSDKPLKLIGPEFFEMIIQ